MGEKGLRILVKGVNWVGDALMATPALEHLRRSHPDAHISLMIRPWVAAVYEHNPDINELLIIDEAESMMSFMRAVGMARAGRFQMGIAFPNSMRSATLLKMAGIPTRVGYDFPGRGLLLNRLAHIPEHAKESHQVYYYLG